MITIPGATVVSLVSLVSLAVAVAVLIAGCGDDRPSVASKARPDWVGNPMIDGQIGAVGIARPSLAGEQQTIDQAMAAARTELARTLSTRIEAAYKTAFNSSSDFKSGHDPAQVAHELTENVSKQLSNEVLQGSRRRDLFTDAASGDHYVWVVMERSKALGERISSGTRDALTQKGIATPELEDRIAAEITRLVGEPTK
ncbi:MAG: LPP20 family lipoprotein [Planctomycetes bacterium]|nr:LPP20 family lipoprotein [Planctomycetota bacterium]